MTEGISRMLSNPQLSLVPILRALAALEAAGAFDPTPIEVMVNGIESCLIYLQYARAGVGGDMQFLVEISPYSADALAPAGFAAWHRATVFAPGVVASGADTLSNLQRDGIEYGSTAAGVESFAYGPLEFGQCVERLRISCAESGAVGTPGAAAVTAVLSPL